MLIKCDVHGWMKSYIAVLKHPFLRHLRREGQLRDQGCAAPVTYQLMIWHEFLGSQTLPITLTKNQTLELEPVVFER